MRCMSLARPLLVAQHAYPTPRAVMNAFAAMMSASAAASAVYALRVQVRAGVFQAWTERGRPAPAAAHNFSVEAQVAGQQVLVLWEDFQEPSWAAIPRQHGSAVGNLAAHASPSPAKAIAPTALLKSCLQKCVRRMQGPAATRCARALAAQDLPALLRRLLVIAAEDTCISPGHAIVAAAMVLSKSYVLQGPGLQLVLHLVSDMAECTVRDVPDAPSRPAAQRWAASPCRCTGCAAMARALQAPSKPGQKRARTVAEPSLPPAVIWQANALPTGPMVLAAAIRSEYGGMQGDVQLLRRMAWAWYARGAAQLHATSSASASAASSPRAYQAPMGSTWDDVGARARSEASLRALSMTTGLHDGKWRCTCSLAQARFKVADMLTLSKLDAAQLWRGVDAHCSSIVRSALAQPAVRASLAKARAGSSLRLALDSSDDASLLRQLMWHCSGGVNVRTCLAGLGAPPGAMPAAVWGDDDGWTRESAELASSQDSQVTAALQPVWDTVASHIRSIAQQHLAGLLPDKPGKYA